MKLTDRKATDLIRNSGASQVGKLIESYPESIAGNRTDLQTGNPGDIKMLSYGFPLKEIIDSYGLRPEDLDGWEDAEIE